MKKRLRGQKNRLYEGCSLIYSDPSKLNKQPPKQAKCLGGVFYGAGKQLSVILLHPFPQPFTLRCKRAFNSVYKVIILYHSFTLFGFLFADRYHWYSIHIHPYFHANLSYTFCLLHRCSSSLTSLLSQKPSKLFLIGHTSCSYRCFYGPSLT